LTENQTIRLLVVSREPAVLRLLWSMDESRCWSLETADSGWDAMERVQSGTAPDLLLLDIPRGDTDSLHLLRWLRRLRADLPVVVLCYPDDAATGKEATRLGAGEILARPFDELQLKSVIRRHVGLAAGGAEMIHDMIRDTVSDNVEQLGPDAFFVSASLIMQKLRAQAALLAQSDVPVLVLGESGSGKCAVASLIHKLSVRSGFKLLRVNCAETPEALLASKLFGDERASLGNGRSSLGRFAAGEKGTIYLNEITAMPLALQSRLLQALQSQAPQNHGSHPASSLHAGSHRASSHRLSPHYSSSEFGSLAEADAVAAEVRIIAASSVSLERAVGEKQLREDLYYRLSAFTVHVPPLRQRKDEIAILLRYFMHKLAKHYGLAPRGFSSAMLDSCEQYSWPGNLKEMETFVKRYLVAGGQATAMGEMNFDSSDTTAGLGAASPRLVAVKWEKDEKGLARNGTNPESLRSLIQGIKSEAEQSAIAAALRRTGWNRKAAARLLRVSYRTLLYKIDQYHMRAPEPVLSPLPVDQFAVFGNEVKNNGKAS
jgi:two-component system response regulator AtoC